MIRRSNSPLAANDLVLTLNGDGGSQMRFVFQESAVPLAGNGALTTEHLNVDARLLRPDRYVVGVAVDGVAAQIEIDIYSHLPGRSQGRLQEGKGVTLTQGFENTIHRHPLLFCSVCLNTVSTFPAGFVDLLHRSAG